MQLLGCSGSCHVVGMDASGDCEGVAMMLLGCSVCPNVAMLFIRR